MFKWTKIFETSDKDLGMKICIKDKFWNENILKR